MGGNNYIVYQEIVHHNPDLFDMSLFTSKCKLVKIQIRIFVLFFSRLKTMIHDSASYGTSNGTQKLKTLP